jgi:hypothetical protein
MKRRLLNGFVALIVFCVATLFLVASVNAQGKQDFDLVNRTGITITEVYITPHDANDWGENVFTGDEPLKDGESTTIVFSRKEKAKWWDLYVIDKAGNRFQWNSLNLLEISEVTLIQKCTVSFSAK